MLNLLFKSIIDQDSAPIVICDMRSIIVYMNQSAIEAYHRDLTGSDLKECHNADSNEKIDRVLAWFEKSKENNIVFTFHDEKKNRDEYMVALRNENGELIGYYEKHEFRNPEESKPYESIKI